MGGIELANTLVFVGAALLLLGVLSSTFATRFGAPLLLVFLVLGMLAGEDGPGGIEFNDFRLTYLVGSSALAVILFDGGLRTKLSAFSGVLAPSMLLATIGVIATAALTGLAAAHLLHVGWWQGLLVGSIVAATDAAAVFVLIRSGGLQLRRRVGAILEIESGTNDPMAVFLTFLIIGVLTAPAHAGGVELTLSLLREASIGAALGLLGGITICFLVNRIDLAEGLHPLLVVAMAIAVYAATVLLHGSGYLAAFVAGVVVGNRPVRAYASIVSFHDTATWLCQIVMFLLLGLLSSPSRLVLVAVPALTIAAFLMVVARPVAVWICLAPFGFTAKEVGFVGWVGLRGAVSIFLATVPLLANLPGALAYFDVAFFVVLVSLLVQGWTIAPAARWLGLALPRTTYRVHRVELDLPGQLAQELVGYHVPAGSPLMSHGGLPRWARPVLVVRRQHVLAPADAGAFEADDYVYLLSPTERAHRLDRIFAVDAAPAEGPLPGEFPLDGATPLRLLRELYGMEIHEADSHRTIAEMFADRFEGQPQPGDRLPLGEAMLIVRELDEDRVVRVGLTLEGLAGSMVGAALARRPLGRRVLRYLSRFGGQAG